MGQRCECSHTANAGCCGGQDQEIFRVTRDEHRMSVCSRCTLPGDTDRVLAADINMEDLLEVDKLGFLQVLLKREIGE